MAAIEIVTQVNELLWTRGHELRSTNLRQSIRRLLIQRFLIVDL